MSNRIASIVTSDGYSASCEVTDDRVRLLFAINNKELEVLRARLANLSDYEESKLAAGESVRGLTLY